MDGYPLEAYLSKLLPLWRAAETLATAMFSARRWLQRYNASVSLASKLDCVQSLPLKVNWRPSFTRTCFSPSAATASPLYTRNRAGSAAKPKIPPLVSSKFALPRVTLIALSLSSSVISTSASPCSTSRRTSLRRDEIMRRLLLSPMRTNAPGVSRTSARPSAVRNTSVFLRSVNAATLLWMAVSLTNTSPSATCTNPAFAEIAFCAVAVAQEPQISAAASQLSLAISSLQVPRFVLFFGACQLRQDSLLRAYILFLYSAAQISARGSKGLRAILCRRLHMVRGICYVV